MLSLLCFIVKNSCLPIANGHFVSCSTVSLALQRTSQEYRDACELWDLFISTKARLLEDQKSGEETGQEHKGKIILKVGKLVGDKLSKVVMLAGTRSLTCIV